MSKLAKLLCVSGLAVAAAGCHRKGSMERAGEKADEKTESAGRSVGNATEKAGDKVEDATDRH